MEFSIEKQTGRTLQLGTKEFVCGGCAKNLKTYKKELYYFDYDKRLWCWECVASKQPRQIPVSAINDPRNIRYQWWLLDKIIAAQEDYYTQAQRTIITTE